MKKYLFSTVDFYDNIVRIETTRCRSYIIFQFLHFNGQMNHFMRLGFLVVVNKIQRLIVIM